MPRQALREMPPLIKGYLRLGGYVGDGAVVDYQFGTTDVCVVVQMASVTGKYRRHYIGDEAKQPETEAEADPVGTLSPQGERGMPGERDDG